MFDIGWSEMAVILLVALIVIGPKDLPRLARTMGQWAGKGRAMAREFQRALEDMAREAELDKVKSEIEKAGRTDLGKTIEKTIDPSGELSRAFDPTVPDSKRAVGTAPAGAAATPATATVTPTQPESSLATGAPTQLSTAAVAPAGPTTSEGGAAASNGAGVATPRKRTTRAAKAPAGPEPSTPAGNGAGAAGDRKKSRRATAPTESS
jgi:sec-independent protein translocase protein TatB